MPAFNHRLFVRLLLVLTAMVCFAAAADAATKYSVRNGRWDAASTWSPSSRPKSGDDVIIRANHVVELGNTTTNTTYTIRSLEVQANGRLQSLNNSWRTRVVTTANGPTGYSVLNRGQIHGQINRTSVIECRGNLKTDGSGISNRGSKPMGGFSWGWNNLGHSGNPWAHGHTGNNGDSTPGICLILTGGSTANPATIEQAQTVNINTAPFTASQDALPRTFIKGVYELKNNLEINAFESRVELGGVLDLNGYRMQVQGPLHTGDPGFNTVSYNKSTSTQGTFAALGSGSSVVWRGPGKSYSQAPAKLSNVFPSNWSNNQGSNGTFNFYGKNVRDVWVSVNGWVGFRNSYSSSYPYNRIPNVGYANGIAMPGGYYSGLPSSNEYVKYQVVGSSPNRELVVEWRARYFNNSSGTQFRTQCRLQEGSNKIVFKYGSGGLSAPNWNSRQMYMLIGIEDLNGSNGKVHGNSQWPVYRTEPNSTITWTPQFLSNPNATLRVGDGQGSANQNSYPQFRVTAGAANIWGSGSNILIPNGENGSMFIGAAVQMLGTAQLNILGEPSVPTTLRNGGAPTCWVIGYFALGGTAQVNCTVPANPANPTNAMLQVGQALDFLDNQTTPPTASQAVVNLTGNHGATGFPVLLVQGGSGGGLNFITNSVWAGQPGGVTPGIDTAGMNMTNSVFVHQGGLATHDAFKVSATGGNPGSLWGPHSIVLGLDQYQWQSAAVTIANGTNLEMGGTGTDWDLDGVALQVKGNRAAVNGGGGNVFASNGAKFAAHGVAANLPANGSVGMVDLGGNLQVTSAAQWYFGADLTGTTNQTGHESTMRILGQGTIPPALGVGPLSLQRRAPLGNLSIDDGGSMTSAHADNVLVFIGEKWHSASTTVKVHPWNVENLISYRNNSGNTGPYGDGTSRIDLRPSGGTGPWTFTINSGGGTLTGGTGAGGGGRVTSSTSTPVTYACPAGNGTTGASGTAVVRCVDTNGESFDAVVSYRPKSLGALMLSPGYITKGFLGYCYYLRSNVSNFKPTVTLRAYGGTSATYSWSKSSSNGTLSSTSGAVVTFTAGNSNAANTVTLTNGSDTRRCRIYHTSSTFYGDRYPSPYYFVHLRINETQQLRLRPAMIKSGTSPAWSFTSNSSGASFTGTGASSNGKTASGATATINSGNNGGLQTYRNYTRGQVTWRNTSNQTITGYFYFYVTALPSDLTLGPTEVSGWLPGASLTFTGAGGGNTPVYTYSLSKSGGGNAPKPSVNSGGTNPNRTGTYTAGGGSLQDDEIELGDGSGNTAKAVVKKGLATPPNGNSFTAVPGARAIFTNSSTNSVDQIIFADGNDDFGRLQILKTLNTGNKVLPSSIEISPILLTMINGTRQTFTVAGGTAPYTYSISTNRSGATINATTGRYRAGSTFNVTDTVLVTDANGKIARATVNVVNQGGASPLEIRPRYIYYFYPGQKFQFRTAGGKGGIAWTMTQNNSGGGVSGAGLYTAGRPGGTTAWDTIQVSDATGDVDYARVGVYNYRWTSLYMFPAYAYRDYNTGAGKSRNGFMPGQTLAITTRNAATSATWSISTNRSGSSLSGSGRSATWTAGTTGNVTDIVQVRSGGRQFTGRFKVQPPPMAVSPSQASVFGGTTLTFSALGGTGNYSYSVRTNNSGSTTAAGSGATFNYTAGASPGIDIIRVSDGVSFADVAVSVLGAANPTVVNCSMLEVFHGELDLNGRILNVVDRAQPNARGDAWFLNGGFTGAVNPKLSMTAVPTAQDPAKFNVGRTFVWNRNADENVTAGTITVDGSINVTDRPGGPTFDLNAPATSSSRVIVTGNNPDYPASSPVRAEVWRATTTGGAPSMAGFSFANLQAGPSSSSSNIVRFAGPVCYQTPSGWSTQTTVPTIENSSGATITKPVNNCSVAGGAVPPGFTQWTSLTNPSTLPASGTIPSGAWLTFGGTTNSSASTCWTITGTVTVQGGLVIENGCVDIQGPNGRLIVQGDVYIGTGQVAQDRNLAPTIRFSGSSGTPRLDVRESSPGTGGSFNFNVGAVANFNRRSIIEVEGSFKALEDATNGIAFAPTNVDLRMTGAHQEAASGTSPVSSRLWLADDNFAAQPMTVRRLQVNKANATDKVDLNSTIVVTNTFDVQSGDVYGTLGNGAVELQGSTWTNGASANYDNAGGTIGSNNWGPFNVYLDGSGGTVQSVSASTSAPVPVLPTTRLRHTGTGVGAGHVHLTSNVTAQYWYMLDGTFDPNGNTLTTILDIAVGGNVPADATNQPELFMNAAADEVVAGQHFLFFPGAVETVTNGLIEAGGDFAITDTVGSPFALNVPTLVRMSGPDVPTGPSTTRPAQIFSQDATNQPQTLQLGHFEINLNPGATSTVDLMSNVQVNGTFTLLNGNVQGTNGTLLLAGNWTSTGGAYGTFFNGAIQITGAQAQTFQSTIPVPPVTITKGGAGIVTLNGSFQTLGNLRLQDGVLDVNGAVLTVNGDFWVGTGVIATDRTRAPELRANLGGTQATIRVLSTTTFNGNFNFFGGCVENVTNCLLEAQRNVALEEDTNTADTSNTGRAIDFFAQLTGAGNELRLTGANNAVVFLTDGPLQQNPVTLEVDDLTIAKATVNDTVAFTSGIRVNGTYLHTEGRVTSGVIFVDGATFTVTGGAYNAGVSIVVASPATQTFTSTVTLPQLFINKPGTNPLLVGNGATLQTGNFTIQDGTVDLNGGTLVVSGNFSVGDGTANDAVNVPNFILSTVVGSQNGGTLDILHTTTGNGNFQFFEFCTATIDTSTVFANGNIYVNDGSFAFTGTNTVEMRNSRGATASLWADRPVVNPVLTTVNLTLNKTPAGAGQQVDIGSDVVVSGVFDVRGNTIVNGLIGTNGPIQLTGAGGVLTTSGTSGSFTAGTTIEVLGASNQTLTSGFPLGVVIVNKTAGTVFVGTGGLQTGIFQLKDGTLDLAGQTLRVNGWMEIGNQVPPGGVTPNLLCNNAASVLQVIAPASTIADGTMYWFADATGTLSAGQFDIEGNVDVRATTWAPTGTHKVRLFLNRGSAVTASANVTPAAYTVPTLVFNDFEVAKSGTSGNGIRVDLNISDVAVQGTFTLTSGVVNTDTGSGAFILKLEGNSTGTGGSFTSTSWVSFEGTSAQTMGGTGGSLPNVQIQKTGTGAASTVSINATIGLESLLILDGIFDVQAGANVTIVGGVTVGIGGTGPNLTSNRTLAPEFRMSTSGTLAIGQAFAFWAGSVEGINGGTINLTGNLALEEDSTGPKFDLSGATGAPLFNFTGGTSAQIFLQDELGAAQTLELWDVTVSKNTGITATFSGPVEVYGTFTMQSGILATSGFGVVSLRGNWTHNGGTYATGSRMALTGTGAQTLQAAGGVLPSITIDKASGTAQVANGSTVQIGSPTGGELFWVKRGVFSLNGGTLQVNGIVFIGDNSAGAGTGYTPAPQLASITAGSVMDVNSTTAPPSGFAVDGDFVLQHNGTSTNSSVNLTTGTLRVEHRLAIDHTGYTSTLAGTPAVVTSGTPLTGGAFNLRLDGNAATSGNQGAGEIFNLKGILTVTNLEVVKSTGGTGNVARLLSGLDVMGNVLVTSGNFDLGNQGRIDLAGNWTVQAAAGVTPTITQLWLGTATTNTITVNSGLAALFDLVINKPGATDQVIFTSTSAPAQPVVVERQLLIYMGAVTVNNNKQLTVGANSWLGNLLVGVTGITNNPADASLDIQPSSVVAMGSGATFGVDVNGVFEQVGTNAAARARLISSNPGAGTYQASVSGVWRAQWYEVSSTNTQGFQLGGTATTPAPAGGQALSDGLWDYPANGGIFLDLSNGPAMPSAVYRNNFNNTGGVTANGNIQASGSTFTVMYLNAGGVLAGEGFDIEPVGPAPIYWNIATVNVAAATGTPPVSNVLAGTLQHPIGSFTLSETSSTEGADITSVAVTSSQALTNLANITLYNDADNSGTVTTGDTNLGAPVVAASTMTWSGAPFLQIASGTAVNLLVVADIGSAATGTYTFSVATAGNVTGAGASFGVAIQITGTFAVTTNGQTVAPSGLLTTALGAQSPAAGNIVPSSQVVMGQWTLSAGALENHTVTALTFNDNLAAAGILGSTHISAALLAVDNNANGTYEAGVDSVLGTATGPVWNGSQNVTFSGLNRTINAGSSLTVLFVQTFTNAVSPTNPDQYRVRLTNITSTGTTSSNTSTYAGLPSPSTIQTVATAGSLDVAVGANNPTATAVVRTATNAVMGQFRIQVSQAEALSVTQVVVTNSGTGATSNVTAVRLILDANNNGAVDTSDTTLASGTLSGATATLTLTRVIPASGIEHWLVVYDLSAPVGELGNTHNVTLANGSVTGTGQTSTNALVLTGTPVSGGAKTLTDGAPVLTVSTGTNDPGARSISAGSTGVTLLQANLAATGENQTVSAVQVTLSGSADDSLAISALYLVDDANGNGIADTGELVSPLAGPLTVATDDASMTITGLSYAVTTSPSRNLLVVVDTSASGVQNGQTITATLTTVTATGDTSSLPSTTPGAPLAGGAHTLAVPGTLNVLAGAFMPGNQNLPSGTVAAPIWQGRVSANNTEDLLLTTFQVTQNSGMVGVFGAMRLYWDSNSNGQLDAADVALTPAGTLAGTTLPLQLGTAWNLNFRISAGTSQNLLLVADIAGSLGQTAVISVETGDVGVQGISSGLDETTGIGISGLPVAGGTVTVGANGSVVVYTGANTSPSRTEPSPSSNVPMGQFTLRASPAEAATLNSITFTGYNAGAADGNDATELGNITLYEDVDGDGRLSAAELAGNQLGTAQTYSANNGTVTFGGGTPLGATIPQGGDLHVVLVYDIAASVATGQQFLAGLVTGANVSVTGQLTSSALPVTSASARTNFLTVGASEELVVSAGTPWPSAVYIPPSNLPASNVLLSVLRLEASNGGSGIDVAGLTLWPSGTGNDAQTTVSVWDDRTGTNPGVLDAADTLLGQSTYPGDNQPWTMTLTPAVQLSAGATSQWLVTHSLASAAYGDTFEVRVTPAADVASTGVLSGSGVTATGQVIQSATLTIASPPSFGGPVAVASGSSGGGCFIATAAAGYDSSLVTGLVQGRDTILPGAIVAGYYRTSPPVAAAVAAHPGAAAGVRGGLAPFAGWAATGSLAGLLGLLLLTGLALVVTRRREPVVVKA